MAKAGPEQNRRAGLRPDERDPDDDRREPGSAGGGPNMAGTAGGGLAAGGLGGTNAGDGAPDENLEDAFGVGIHDDSGDTGDGGPPYAGPTGGAVGGTPAQKRAKGGHTGRGIAPGGDIGDDRTIGGKPR